MYLLLRSVLWAMLCPGTVTLLLPRLIISETQDGDVKWSRFQWSGILLIGTGVCVLLRCIYAFARQGRGTLSPLDPARRLVVTGLYRYVRNPMYVSVMVLLTGEALFFESWMLSGYAGLVFLVFSLFIRLYEEPYLRRQFGEEYEWYCKHVGRWLPGKPFQL